MKKRILLIEDEPGLVLTLTDRLVKEGFEVESVRDGDAGIDLALARYYDVILLDIMLPGRNGFDICRDFRQSGKQTPILMLTARGMLADKVVGLKLGADDYLTKPFEMMELLARIEALLRRAPAPSGGSGDAYTFGDVRIDFHKAEVEREGRQVVLSAKELALLRCFVQNRGVVLSRDDLLNRVWGYDAMPFTRTVDVHVAGLRQQLEADPRHPKHILTVHGMGYKFVG